MNRCPDCGSELAGSTRGLCPKCLMKAAMGSDIVQESPADEGPEYAQTNVSRGGFVPPAAESLKELFPHLEILETLGHGGMGAVYKANQTKLDRIVALKIIRPESAEDPAFAERFNREARTLARLNHPNIVGVFDFGEVDYVDHVGTEGTLYYFLMEFVDGANLRQLIHAGETKPVQALAIVPQICEALQYAHDNGVVHRDIKPDNILLDKSGQVKIADFGLAKLGSESGDFTLTATHQILGTVRYMAPEQLAQSNTVDHRADIYSLGVVFYEMLTGEIPVGAFDPPSKRTPSVDGRLDEVVMRALASDPARRYQTAGEIGGQVSDISSSTNLAPPPLQVENQPALPGPSTIIDRGVGAIVGGLAGLVSPRTDGHDPDLDSVVSGDTYVTISRRQIETNQLPDCCMVCGKHTKRRISKEFEHTPEWAGIILVFAFILFFPVGIVLAVMLNKKMRMNCPICAKHTRHWSTLNWFAGLGWMIIPLGVITSLYVGSAFDGAASPRRSSLRNQIRSAVRVGNYDGAVDEATDQIADAVSGSADRVAEAIEKGADNFAERVENAVADGKTTTKGTAASAEQNETTEAPKTSDTDAPDEVAQAATGKAGPTSTAEATADAPSDEAAAEASSPGESGSSPFIIVMGILGSIAAYVIPLVYLCCTRVAVEKLTDDTVTFKRVSTNFSHAVIAMAHQQHPAEANPVR